MLAMRLPSMMPALSAGPFSLTPETNTPSVSRLLPLDPSEIPSAGRSSASWRDIRSDERSFAATVFTFTVL